MAEMEGKPETSELLVSPPESGFSMNWQMVDGFGCAVQVTMRTALLDDWADAIRVRTKFIDGAMKHGWTVPGRPSPAPPPAPNKAAEIVAEANPQLAAEMVAQDASVPPPPDGKTYQTVDTQEIHITPQADGLIKLEFWNPGRKYPEEYLKGKPERVAGLLKYVTSADVNKAQKLACRARVYYVLGKEKNNKPGEHWHDICHVRPLD
jgi:hypothetical protein